MPTENTKKSPESLIARVNGTLSMEGMPLSDSDKAALAAHLRGDLTDDEYIHIASPVRGRAR